MKSIVEKHNVVKNCGIIPSPNKLFIDWEGEDCEGMRCLGSEVSEKCGRSDVYSKNDIRVGVECVSDGRPRGTEAQVVSDAGLKRVYFIYIIARSIHFFTVQSASPRTGPLRTGAGVPLGLRRWVKYYDNRNIIFSFVLYKNKVINSLIKISLIIEISHISLNLSVTLNLISFFIILSFR